jgi:hypothetical protein
MPKKRGGPKQTKEQKRDAQRACIENETKPETVYRQTTDAARHASVYNSNATELCKNELFELVQILRIIDRDLLELPRHKFDGSTKWTVFVLDNIFTHAQLA